MRTHKDREHTRGDEENNGIVPNENNPRNHQNTSQYRMVDVVLAAADEDVAGEGALAAGWPSPPLNT